MRAEPTYATPRSPDRYTDGPAVGRGIERWQGRRPTPWQQAQLDVALERVDGPGSAFAYDEVIAIVGRRCGKTVTSMGVPLIRALAGPVLLPNGRRLPFRGVHVAQNISAAQQRFAEDLVGPYKRRFSDEAWDAGVRDLRSNGNTRLVVDPRRHKRIAEAEKLEIASELRVLAPTGSSARGAGVFHRTYDEELTYLLERGTELAEAGRPTMAELQGHGQTWHVSNIKRDTDRRYFLWHQREKGRAAVAAGRRTGVCYLEFSIPPGEDPGDERNWWKHYPALGDGIVNIQQLRRDREEFSALPDGVAGFYAEYLGRWADENDTGVSGWAAINVDDYLASLTDDPQPDDAPAAIGVDIDPYGRSSTITAAVADAAGRPLLEVIDHRPGSDWVLDRVVELAGDVAAIGADDFGPMHDLVLSLRELPATRDRLVVTSGQDFYAACYNIEAAWRERRIGIRRSDYHESLTFSAAAAERSGIRAWQWVRLVSTSQSPVISATLALWALQHRPVIAPPSEIF